LTGELQVWFDTSTNDSGEWRSLEAVKLNLGEPLTASKLQRFPWKRMLAIADAGSRQLGRPPDRVESDVPMMKVLRKAFGEGFARPAESPPKGRPGRKGHSDEEYRAVADGYLQLVADGVTNPATQIAEQFNCSPSTVRGWISTCREKGYLPPARRGKPG
jgi:hypothetical protein